MPFVSLNRRGVAGLGAAKQGGGGNPRGYSRGNPATTTCNLVSLSILKDRIYSKDYVLKAHQQYWSSKQKYPWLLKPVECNGEN